MKIDTTLALMGAVLALGAAPAYAEKTNYDLTVSFQMTYYQNGQTPRLGIATKDLIYAMTNSQIVTVAAYTYTNAAATNISTTLSNTLSPGWGCETTNGPTRATVPAFDTHPKLVYRQAVGPNGVTHAGFYVLDGKTVPLADVTPFITRTTDVSVTPAGSGKASTYSWGAFNVVCRLPFSVNGLATTTTGLSGPGGATVLQSLKATVFGTEETNRPTSFGVTTTNVISGTITYGGGTLE